MADKITDHRVTASFGILLHRVADIAQSCALLSGRNTGSLVSFETGESVSYGLFNAQERGALFIGPGVAVYEGMVVGVSPKQEDITVNVCRKKQMTNMRAAGSDEKAMLPPPVRFSLEEALEYIQEDELVEVTPKSMRIRKIILDPIERKRKNGDED